MKKILLFPFVFSIYFGSIAQSDCSKAQAHIVYAFNNAKNSLQSNNITHLKHYANKALESFERVQSVLGDCNCDNVETYAIESIEKLSKVPPILKMAEAQYFVGKAKENAQKIITALDYCTLTDKGTTIEITSDVTDLEHEQMKLKQQQELLRRQQETLKQQLAKQKEEELLIEKQQLIVKTNAAITKNIQAYNEVLNACNCNSVISDQITSRKDNELISKSVDEIKSHYLKSVKDLTSNYMNMLSTCDNEE